jgi:hypothetical protein
MDKLLVIYDLMQHSIKIGNETERSHGMGGTGT